MIEPAPCDVYVFRRCSRQELETKVGIAAIVMNRRDQLQRQVGDKLGLLGLAKCPSRAAAYELEQATLRAFRRVRKPSTEWLYADARAVAAVMVSLAEDRGIVGFYGG